MSKVTDNQGNATQYDYDANNNLSKLTEGLAASNLTGKYTIPKITQVPLNNPAYALWRKLYCKSLLDNVTKLKMTSPIYRGAVAKRIEDS